MEKRLNPTAIQHTWKKAMDYKFSTYFWKGNEKAKRTEEIQKWKKKT